MRRHHVAKFSRSAKPPISACHFMEVEPASSRPLRGEEFSRTRCKRRSPSKKPDESVARPAEMEPSPTTNLQEALNSSENRTTIFRYSIGAEAGLLIAKSIFLALTGLVVIEAGFCIQPPLGDLRDATWGTIFYGNILVQIVLVGAILTPLPYAALCLQNGVPQFPCPSEDYQPQERRDYAPGTRALNFFRKFPLALFEFGSHPSTNKKLIEP